MVDIPQVQRQALLHDNVAPATDLGQPGEAGPDVVSPCFLVVVHVQVPHEQRSGSDKAHVSCKDVPKLGKLVEAGPAQNTSEPCRPLRVIEKAPVTPSRLVHCPELEQHERAGQVAGPLLAE